MANRKGKDVVAPASRPPAPIIHPAPPVPPVPVPAPSPSASRPRAYKTPALTAKDEGKNPFVMRLGRLLRRARVRRCMSQEQLGAISRIHRTHISLIECGRRDLQLTTICALAAALRINPGELMPVLFLSDKAAITPPAPSASMTPSTPTPARLPTHPPPAHL